VGKGQRRGGLYFCRDLWVGAQQAPASALRFGRDDKLGVAAYLKCCESDGAQQVPPLRCAPVGMTSLLYLFIALF